MTANCQLILQELNKKIDSKGVNREYFLFYKLSLINLYQRYSKKIHKNKGENNMSKRKREEWGVNAGDITCIKGVTAFTRDAIKRLEGKALEEDNARRKQNIPNSRPQSAGFYITISNPMFEDGVPLAEYYKERIFQTKTEPGVNRLTLKDPGMIPPKIFIKKDEMTLEKVENPEIIPQNVEVEIYVDTFKTQEYGLSGGIDTMIFPVGTNFKRPTMNEDNSVQILQRYGYTIVGSGNTPQNAPAQPQVANPQTAITQGAPVQQAQEFNQGIPTAGFGATAPNPFAQGQVEQAPNPFAQTGQPTQGANQFGQQATPFATPNPYVQPGANPFV